MPRTRTAASGATAQEVEVGGRVVRLSHLDRQVFPAAGWTKADVVGYYAAAGPALLAHVRGRPMTLRRFPEGVRGPSRYLKCCPEPRPPWVRVAEVPRVGGGPAMDPCLVDDLASLVWAANLGCLELHPMLARAEDLDRPTAVVLDLDPGPPAGLLEACEVALLARAALAGVGLRAWVKTSGGKGLHVVVPLQPAAPFARTRAFARTVAEVLAAERPSLVLARGGPAARAGRVLVDWGQNARHKSIVAPYSLRAAEHPEVSAPVRWEEIEAAVREHDAAALRCTPRGVLARLERDGDLHAPVIAGGQRLPGG